VGHEIWYVDLAEGGGCVKFTHTDRNDHVCSCFQSYNVVMCEILKEQKDIHQGEGTSLDHTMQRRGMS